MEARVLIKEATVLIKESSVLKTSLNYQQQNKKNNLALIMLKNKNNSAST